MLATRCLRRLLVDHDGRPHLSSASGLALVGDHLYIVADDENHLARLDARDVAGSPLQLVRFASGTLPADAGQRKAAKPDLESLIVFPAVAGEPALLVAWGSCSRPQRESAHVFTLGADGALKGESAKVSLAALCDPLRDRFGELNLEAGFVRDGELHVFQRAHGGQPLNGHIRWDARAVRDWLTGAAAAVPAPLAMEAIDLGDIDGVPLGITDAAVWPEGGWIFSAVAEATSDAYADGACVGSVVGWAGADGRVMRCERLAGGPKVEGLAIAGPGRLWLVTDADDPARASELLELGWPPA